MKWFKHETGSLSDPVIFEAIAKFKGDGYLVFFGTLELMGDEFDIFNPGTMTFSWKYLRKNLQLSRQKLTTIYTFFDEKARENKTKDKGFMVSFNYDGVTINCKKFARLCDNHTQKLLRDRAKQLQSEDKVTLPHRSKNKEVRNKKKIYIEGEMPYDLSLYLLQKIRKNKPDFKEPNLQKWAKDMDLLLSIDKRIPLIVSKVIMWCQQDDFWRFNILSPDKLRKQFDTLEMQMIKDQKKHKKEIDPEEKKFRDEWDLLSKEEQQRYIDKAKKVKNPEARISVERLAIILFNKER